MPSVVILHAAEDALPARALAEKLRQAKLTPIIEKPSGEAVREAVKGAAVTIALWSPRSVAQPGLAEDAVFARGKSKLVHATMQSAQPPEQFRKETPIDLTGWRGEDDFKPWLALAQQVTSKAGVAPLPPPTPRPPSGFFQPGRVDPAREAAVQAQAPKGVRLERPPNLPPANLPPVKHAQRPAGQQQPAQPQAARPAQQARPAPQPRAAAAQPASAAAEKSGGGKGMLIGAIVFLVVAAAGAGGYYFWSQSQNQPAATEAAGPSASEIQQAFDAAYAENTVEAMEGFLAQHPNSEFDMRARGRIAELQSAASSAPTTAAPIEPEPTEAAPAPDALASPPVVNEIGPGPESIAPPAEPPPAPPEDAPPSQ